MHNLRTIFICVLFATQTFAMEFDRNQENEKITIPRRVETLKQLAAQCLIRNPHIYSLEQIDWATSNKAKKECVRQYYLIHGKYIFGFKKKDFTFSLAELVNHGKITISSGQKTLNLRYKRIHVIYPLTLQVIDN